MSKYRLEQHYPGDGAWAVFVKSLPQQVLDADFVESLNGHKDIASAIWFLVGPASSNWIMQPIPALDGVTPIACTENPLLIHRLKSMLMRMPC